MAYCTVVCEVAGKVVLVRVRLARYQLARLSWIDDLVLLLFDRCYHHVEDILLKHPVLCHYPHDPTFLNTIDAVDMAFTSVASSFM